MEHSKKEKTDNAFTLQEKNKIARNAFISLSEACRLSEMKLITQQNIAKIKRYIFQTFVYFFNAVANDNSYFLKIQ